MDGGPLAECRFAAAARRCGQLRSKRIAKLYFENGQPPFDGSVFAVVSLRIYRAARSETTGETKIMVQHATIYITKTDRDRLGNMIELARNQDDRANLPYVGKLEDVLEFAEVVPSDDIPPDVVTMRSKIKLKDLDTGEEKVYSIVFPTEANFDEGKISILAPLATALLGYKRGDTVEVEAPARLRRLLISEILYQPESVGDFDL
jgi:regulator of nucleoside diphosphate kinase